MALVECKECKKEVSKTAKTCPHCGVAYPSVKEPSTIGGLISAAIVLAIIFAFVSGGDSDTETSEEAANKPLDSSEAEVLCGYVIKKYVRDPEKTEIPNVKNVSSGHIHTFTWSRETRLIRSRNGLGLEVPVEATCTMDGVKKEVVSLTIDGEKVI